MKMVSHIEILNHKMSLCRMVHANFVILVGQQFAIKEERHIVVHLIMLLLKFFKAHNMICL